MDVLWGAWIRDITYKTEQAELDIVGIYHEIWRSRRNEFPFTTNLKVVLSFQAYPSEFGQNKEVTLRMVDLDGEPLFDFKTSVTVPTLLGESKVRWYEDYELADVEIREPGYYELGVLVNSEEKQNVPLWVLAPKKTTWNPENDSTLEEWIQ